MTLLIAVHLLTGIIVLSVEAIRLKRRGRFDYLSFMLLVFAILYGFAPALFHWANAVGYGHFWTPYVHYEAEVYGLGAYEVAALLVPAVGVALGLGWAAGASAPWRERERRTHSDREASAGKALAPLAWALLAVAMALYYLYTKAYGGFLGILSVAAAIRGGWIETVNPWSFLQRFGGLGIFASYLFFAQLHTDSRARGSRAQVWAGFVASVIFSLYVMLTWGGRLGMASYFLTFILAQLLATGKRVQIGRLLPVMGLMILFLFFAGNLIRTTRNALLRTASSSARPPASSTFVDFALRELSFPIISDATAAYAVGNGDVSPRLLGDLPLAVLYLVPKRFLATLPKKASTVNTQLISPTLYGEVPVDIISWGLYSLGILGPPIVAFFYGVLVRRTQSYVLRLRPRGLSLILFVDLGLLLASSLVYADPVQVLAGAFSKLLGLGITLAYLRMR